MNIEFSILNAATRLLPPLPGCGILANSVRAFYGRKQRQIMDVSRGGYALRLNPNECVDSAFLFYPQLYDRREMAFLARTLKSGDCFLDVGANIGLYSLAAARLVSTAGRVLALEPDPYSFERLKLHRDMNQLRQIEILQIGVADHAGEFTLTMKESGNRGGSSMLAPTTEGIEVSCLPLLDILDQQNIHQIRLMKIDIEGFEFRVLRRFLETAPKERWPKSVLLEYNPAHDELAGGSSLSLMIQHGYRKIAIWSGINVALELPA